MNFYIKTDLEMLITTLKALQEYYQNINKPQRIYAGQLMAIKRILSLIDVFKEHFVEYLPQLMELPPVKPNSAPFTYAQPISEEYEKIISLLNHELNKTKNLDDDENPPMQSEPADEIEEAIKNSTRQLEPNESIQAPEMEIEKNRS